MGNRLNILLCGVFSVILTVACSSGKSPTGPDDGGTGGTRGAVTSTDRVQAAAQTIGTGGGVIRVEKAGDALNGLEIMVPAGAFPESRAITVSEATVTAHTLGAEVQALSPLITIRSAPGYAAAPVTVKIPVTVPDGHIAMGVLYDESRGKIEGLPLVEATGTSVTVALRTFAPSPGSSSGKRLFSAAESAISGNILVVSVAESVLRSGGVIDTGFKPGVDDWEFVNAGSYISPGGHCAGQSISAMWYYYEKKLKGSPSLYGQFDRVRDSKYVLWQDNPRGYRFASTIQEDLDWDSLSRKIFLMTRETPEYHHLSWKAFALSMFLTGEPQYVGLISDQGGHAIIAHKIDYSAGILYVSDPNYPGEEHTITWNGAQFDPYNTMQNTDEADPHPYTGIGYFAKSSMVDWDRIGQRWGELESLTIGNDRFPRYRLWVTDDTGGHELEPSEVVNADSIVVQVQWKNGTVNDRIYMTVFDASGKQVAPEPAYARSARPETIRLNPGETVLGFHIWGDRGTPPEKKIKWLDFQWIPVVSASLSIEPLKASGVKDEAVALTAKLEGGSPESVKYLWDFGDGSSEVSVLNTTGVEHTYAQDGVYEVTLRAYDLKYSPGRLIGTARAEVRIGALLGLLRNIMVRIPQSEPMYGLDIDAGWDDSAALVTDDITLYVRPRFTPSSGAPITKDIPVDYSVFVDGAPVKTGVVVMEPTSDRKHAEGYADVNIGKLAKGRHTLRLVLDPEQKITDPSLTNRDQYRIIEQEIQIVESYF